MGIIYNEKAKSFKLDAGNSSYVMQVFDNKFLSHIYYGKHVPDTDMSYLLGPISGVAPSKVPGFEVMAMDALPFEYPVPGLGDYRDACLEIQTKTGHRVCELEYDSYSIYSGKPKLDGLPATFGNEKECTTLEIVCKDPLLNLEVVLRYTVFEELNVICRSSVIKNKGSEEIYLKCALSACLDASGQDYDVLSLHGAWAKECQLTRQSVNANRVISESSRGVTSAQSSPFMALVSKEVNETCGDVYAMNFVYSGNFYASCEAGQSGSTRMVMGINPNNFTWKLEADSLFETPEVVMVYSSEGLGAMTRTFHDLYRNHLIRCPYGNQDRPILVNNWEATYFDFNETKLLELATEASKCGIEMLVLDDGWFGARSIDDRGLGDWYVNEDKIKGGLGKLTKDVNGLSMKFGLWIEPEMVNPNSDLYREHPDWAIQIPNRTGKLSRTQYVLDWSRKEVRDSVYAQIKHVLDNAHVEYIKWDMNRHLTDLGSYDLPSDRQQELSHRYVLGVYDIMNRLITDFPDLLYENCSSGGARFDAGVLYYSPQIWASDDTDAIERIRIQAGTSLCFPLSSMGSHVSAVPNHQTGRITPFETRGIVALSGTFGYELDVTKLSQEEKDLIKKQTKMFHKYNHLVRNGDLYRLSDVFHPEDYACWSVVSKDRSEALITFVQIHSRPGFFATGTNIKLQGLDPNAKYYVEQHVGGIEPIGTDSESVGDQEKRQASGLGGMESNGVQQISGAALMNGGYVIQRVPGDYTAQLLHFVRVKE